MKYEGQMGEVKYEVELAMMEISNYWCQKP
jgi:hypothetical protein